MERVNLTDIYSKYPQLEDIALRLEASENIANNKNKERKEFYSKNPTQQPSEPFENNRRSRLNAPQVEHAKIASFLTSGRWNDTHHILQSGRKAFEDNLIRIMNRTPDALKIVINSSGKITINSKPEYIDVVINSGVEMPAAEPDTKRVDEDKVVQKIQEQLAGLTDQIKQATPVNSNNVNETVNSLNFAQQLKEIQHTNEIQILKRDHKDEIKEIKTEYEREIADLNETIEDLEYEIAELEAEKLETEENLNGIDERIKKAENPDIIATLGKVGAKVLQEFAKKNIDGIAQFGGIDKEDLQKYFDTKDEDNKELGNKGTEATFSEVSGNAIYPTLTEDKKAYADAFIELTNSVNVDDLKVLVGVLKLGLTDTSTVDKLVLNEMYKVGSALKENLKNQS